LLCGGFAVLIKDNSLSANIVSDAARDAPRLELVIKT